MNTKTTYYATYCSFCNHKNVGNWKAMGEMQMAEHIKKEHGKFFYTIKHKRNETTRNKELRTTPGRNKKKPKKANRV